MSDHITVNVEKFIEITNSIKALHKKVKEFKSAQRQVCSHHTAPCRRSDVSNPSAPARSAASPTSSSASSPSTTPMSLPRRRDQRVACCNRRPSDPSGVAGTWAWCWERTLTMRWATPPNGRAPRDC